MFGANWEERLVLMAAAWTGGGVQNVICRRRMRRGRDRASDQLLLALDLNFHLYTKQRKQLAGSAIFVSTRKLMMCIPRRSVQPLLWDTLQRSYKRV